MALTKVKPELTTFFEELDDRVTETQEIQARRDFARWYLTDYLHHDDMMAACAPTRQLSTHLRPELGL